MLSWWLSRFPLNLLYANCKSCQFSTMQYNIIALWKQLTNQGLGLLYRPGNFTQIKGPKINTSSSMAGSIYTELESINSNTVNMFVSAGPKHLYHIYGLRAEGISGKSQAATV